MRFVYKHDEYGKNQNTCWFEQHHNGYGCKQVPLIDKNNDSDKDEASSNDSISNNTINKSSQKPSHDSNVKNQSSGTDEPHCSFNNDTKKNDIGSLNDSKTSEQCNSEEDSVTDNESSSGQEDELSKEIISWPIANVLAGDGTIVGQLIKLKLNPKSIKSNKPKRKTKRKIYKIADYRIDLSKHDI